MKQAPSHGTTPTRPEAAAPSASGWTPDPASCGTASSWDPQLDALAFVDRWNFRLLV